LPKAIAIPSRFGVDENWLITDQEAVPKPDGFGKEASAGKGRAKRRREQRKESPLNHPAFEPLRLGLDEHCHDLRRDFGPILSQPRLAQEAVKYIAKLLVPKPTIGRPRRQDVTEAVRFRAAGQPWRVIYIRLGKHTRDEQYALRAAVRLRKYRLKRKEGVSVMTPALPQS
jgi:hypothetical protein